MNNRREFLTTAAARLTTALSATRVLGANDRLTGAFIGVGTMGTENLKVALEGRTGRRRLRCVSTAPGARRCTGAQAREHAERNQRFSRDHG